MDDQPKMNNTETTKFGFKFGPIVVERMSSDPKHGVWIQLWTGKQIVVVRSTPSGLLRVGNVEKDWHEGTHNAKP